MQRMLTFRWTAEAAVQDEAVAAIAQIYGATANVDGFWRAIAESFIRPAIEDRRRRQAATATASLPDLGTVTVT